MLLCRTNSVTIIKRKSCAWMSQTICDPLPSHTPIKRHSMTPPTELVLAIRSTQRWAWSSSVAQLHLSKLSGSTDQITDQDVPYCDELRISLCNEIRVLADLLCL